MLDFRANDDAIRSHAITSIQKTKAAASRFKLVEGSTARWFHGELNGVAVACQARPVDASKTLQGVVGRMYDPLWWSRNLRREMRLQNEVEEHASGAIRRKTQCYVSDHALHTTQRRARQNRKTLEALEVANDIGQALNLADVSDSSVSNPKLRRAELMTRCKGFQNVAEFMGHEAVFLTLTCPSRFHRFGADSKPNKNWTDETPRDGQKYLNGVWAKTRAEWKRRGFYPYGFRVAEPHHDGCPHWHILLFCPEDQAGWFVPRRALAGRLDEGAGVVGVAGQYALEDSPGEAGALKHRFTVKRIDPAKGDATGYIAKYISKNIDGLTEDGSNVGLDYASGQKATTGASRVRAWASTWGIRQFQQIGGPSVTVWRELRKYKDNADKPLQLELFKNCIAAADRAEWMAFWMLQGGPEGGRAGLLKPKWVTDGKGKYGEQITRVFGAQDRDGLNEVITRMHTWTIQKSGTQDLHNLETERWRRRELIARHPLIAKAAAVTPEAWNEFHSVMRPGHLVPEFKEGAGLPWTRVNNCTDSPKDDEAQALKDDFLRHSWGWDGKTNLESFNHAKSNHGPGHQTRH